MLLVEEDEVVCDSAAGESTCDGRFKQSLGFFVSVARRDASWSDSSMLTVRFLLETLKSDDIRVARLGDEAKILKSGEDSSRESSWIRGRCNLTFETCPPRDVLPLPRWCDIVDPGSSSLLDEIVLELELELS